MPPSNTNKQGLSSWWAIREVDSLFATLGRYRRLVRLGKWSLAGIAGFLTVVLIAWPLLTKDRSGLRVSFNSGATSPSEAPAAAPVMLNPHYSGFGEAGQQYEMTGSQATQQTPTRVIIANVLATMTKPDGSRYTLTAARADYFQDQKRIELYEQVTLVDGVGNTFVTPHATVDTATMHITGQEGIEGVGNLGKLVATSFEIRDKGTRFIFTRGAEPVHVTLTRATKTRE